MKDCERGCAGLDMYQAKEFWFVGGNIWVLGIKAREKGAGDGEIERV